MHIGLWLSFVTAKQHRAITSPKRPVTVCPCFSVFCYSKYVLLQEMIN